jgi:hypothetical protein
MRSDHPNSLSNRWRLDFEGRSLRDLGSKLRSKFCHVVGEERRFVAGTGEGDVAETGVKKIRMDAGVRVDEDTLGGETLGAVAGDGISVVEVAVFAGVELNLLVIVQAGREAAIGMDCLYNGKVAVCDSE